MTEKSVPAFEIPKSAFRNAAQEKLVADPIWWRIKYKKISGPRIAFSRYDFANGSEQIYSMRPDGTDVRNLSNSIYQDGTPTISRINGHIAFCRGENSRDGSMGLYTMNTDGTAQSQITMPPSSSSWDVEPAWSPDGKHIAFTRYFQIWIANADGAGQRPVMKYATLPVVLDHTPSWNPAGTEIAFWRQQAGTSAIMAVNLTPGSSPTYITMPSPNYFDGWPSWSPDGIRVAFWRNDGTQAAIWAIASDGQGLETNISKPDYAHGVRDRTPCWSPDGAEIAFSRSLSIGYDIWIMNNDGSAQRNVSKGPPTCLDFNCSWQSYP